MDNFWGTLPDWLVGLGTIALATVTFVGLVRERREKRRLQQELDSRKAFDEFERRTLYDRQQEQERRAQAEQIVVWSEPLSVEDTNYFDASPVVLSEEEAAIVQNDSSLPITDVWVRWCDAHGSGVLESRMIPTVPPRSRRSIRRPWSLTQNPTLPVEIDFADAHGVLWKRNRKGGVGELD